MKNDVIIIGAGPAGSVVATMLARRGLHVTVLEASVFPRFSIGESLLPQAMRFLEEAELLSSVQEQKYQLKNGADFGYAERRTAFDFSDKFSPGFGTTFQVPRADFDSVLATGAAAQGVKILFGQKVMQAECSSGKVSLVAADVNGNETEFAAKFLVDASGQANVLAALWNHKITTLVDDRSAFFSHVEVKERNPNTDWEKILICVHPQNRDIWYWMIPFSDGRASVGAVMPSTHADTLAGDESEILRRLVSEEAHMTAAVGDCKFLWPARRLSAFARTVERTYGPGFAMIGNAGGFLDPIFSSGLTIALKGASVAAPLIEKELAGSPVDWQNEFHIPLMKGVDAFRHFVNGWYSHDLQDIIFYESPDPETKRKICSILAGYAWDETNPYNQHTGRRLATLAEICRKQ